MENRKIRVAITHGDTNGVGYELIFKTFAEPEMLELCTPIVYGSPKIAAYHRKALDIQANFTIINEAHEAHEGKQNPINGNGGSNVSLSDNPWSAQSFNITKQQEIFNQDPEKARQMIAQAQPKQGFYVGKMN